MAQRDPLVEYEREGHLMFDEMIGGIKEDAVGYLYNLEVQVSQPTSVVPSAVSDLVKGVAAAGAAGVSTAPARTPDDDSSAEADQDDEHGDETSDDAADSPRTSISAAEEAAVITARGLGDEVRARDLQYSGSSVQERPAASRAERRRRERADRRNKRG